ncbi:hypothetical protein OG609_00440 [Streptomyces sp. NBC_01224]|uniref:hypothetical protein n=1 Tax=unclassified Streptomyces TaxID=2593676 RepID=UPI002E160677|nr:hypothetical protein OG609_00440 [Streptomyces sp. NBC_01224]
MSSWTAGAATSAGPTTRRACCRVPDGERHRPKWQFKRAATGSTTFSPKADVPDIVENLINHHRQSRQTVKGLTKQVAKAEKTIWQGKSRVTEAKTPAERSWLRGQPTPGREPPSANAAAGQGLGRRDGGLRQV